MSDNKVLVLGIDGMDPKITNYYLKKGILPNVEKMLKMGSAREDLVMLGGVPTITPPMWTTLSTGAYPVTHGVTCYFNTDKDNLGNLVTNFDSHQVKAEQIWEKTVEAGKKSLVWTWPCSWPPVVENENLHIVGGTAPVGPNAGFNTVEGEHIIYASEAYTEIAPRKKTDMKGGVGCIITDDMREAHEEAEAEPDEDMPNQQIMYHSTIIPAWSCFVEEEGESITEWEWVLPRFNVPITEPKNWKFDVPEGAKEFPLVVSNGLVRYPALILKNAEGKYDTVAVYQNKKSEEPFAKLTDGDFLPTVVSDCMVDGEKIPTTRHFSIVKIDPEGRALIFAAGDALNIQEEAASKEWYPKSLYQQTVDIAGYIPATDQTAGNYPELVSRRVLPSWDVFQKWQAKVLLELIEQNEYEAVFTHNHSCDHLGHAMYRWMKSREKYGWNDEEVYQGFLEEMYLQVDEYIGAFLPLIDKGWDIFVTSDHGLLCGVEDDIPILGDGFVMNIGVMRELGYTVMKKDADGNDTREIDWSKTRAVAPRGNHIYINLKGREAEGIVEPEDKYELERQIIDDLYSYRLDGKRVVNVAVRNKDAILLGMGGEECGDIIYFLEEGFNHLHGDALSTTEGYFDTSVSPIFFAAGPGIKKDYKTNRIIRETDLAPTAAMLLGVDVPENCEGAPVYQILEK